MDNTTVLQNVSYWAAIITPLLIVGAIIFAYTQWRSAQNARVAHILLAITERWDSQDMEIARGVVSACGDDLLAKIDAADTSNSDELYRLVRVANFFDTIGVMIVEGLLDCMMGFKLFGRAEEHYYGLYRPILEDPKRASYFKYFVELHELFRKEEAALSKTKRHFSM